MGCKLSLTGQAKPPSEADRKLVVKIGSSFQEMQNKGEAAGCLWKQKKDGKKDGDGKSSNDAL